LQRFTNTIHSNIMKAGIFEFSFCKEYHSVGIIGNNGIRSGAGYLQSHVDEMIRTKVNPSFINTVDVDGKTTDISFGSSVVISISEYASKLSVGNGIFITVFIHYFSRKFTLNDSILYGSHLNYKIISRPALVFDLSVYHILKYSYIPGIFSRKNGFSDYLNENQSARRIGSALKGDGFHISLRLSGDIGKIAFKQRTSFTKLPLVNQLRRGIWLAFITFFL